jgi:signal transduction histidine kinase
MPEFTVDTHLFRELGELLVGRDSTALVELIKNSYDADASTVTVYGEALDDPELGFIRIADDGSGMTPQEFERGFLRIASRVKEGGERLSKRFHRRFTGAKGIGRLAAHKLARLLEVESTSWLGGSPTTHEAVRATIDWDMVEQQETLNDVAKTKAIDSEYRPVGPDAGSGTVITLRRLRRRWTDVERGRFLGEVQTFEPASVLTTAMPSDVLPEPLLFKKPVVRQASNADLGFRVLLEGAFDGGDNYWQVLARAVSWIIEISAGEDGRVVYAISPTQKTRLDYPEAGKKVIAIDHPQPEAGPFFQARILVRDGRLMGLSRDARAWASRAAGIRLFVEGFRVLPYGEPGNDWLSLDYDYARRTRSLPWLPEDAQSAAPDEDKDMALTTLPGSAYFGGVFMTASGSRHLRMLVNREGFVPDAAYDALVELVRRGIDLSIRYRASVTYSTRQDRKVFRASSRPETDSNNSSPIAGSPRQQLQESLIHATAVAREAKEFAVAGDLAQAAQRMIVAIADVEEASRASEELISEASMLRVLASVGTQMAAFVHEINGLLGMAQAIDISLAQLRNDASVPNPLKIELGRLHSVVVDFHRGLERQAAYLVDVVTPDARRRRSRQSLAERFEAGLRLVERQAKNRSIRILNHIPPELKSPPMFPAELTTVFSNLLTNAVKAAGEQGRIWARAEEDVDKIRLIIENTGAVVTPEDGERWFRPFESTTTSVDPILGQGMGMGLPITRRMLEDYGARIEFVLPSPGYSTAVEIAFAK